MDPITHGLLGATVAKTTMWRRLPHGVGLIGALGAMAPDIDVLIFSPNDATVGWLYHRHFTHSFLLIPLVGLLAALPFLALKRFKDYRSEVILTAIIGCATHTLLDSLTNYGTQQLWPFADTRVTWDAMPIVDPLYSFIFIIGLLFTAKTKNVRGVQWALALSLLYVSFGFWQHQRALSVQQELLSLRGHRPTQARVLPMPGWLLFWRSLYIAEGRLYADGVRVPWVGAAKVLPGGSVAAVALSDLPPPAQTNVEAQRQFKILDWFAGGYLAPVNGDVGTVGDMRLTSSVEGLTPLWGLQFTATGRPQRLVVTGARGRDIQGLARGLIWGDVRYRPLAELRTANNTATTSKGQP